MSNAAVHIHHGNRTVPFRALQQVTCHSWNSLLKFRDGRRSQRAPPDGLDKWSHLHIVLHIIFYNHVACFRVPWSPFICLESSDQSIFVWQAYAGKLVFCFRHSWLIHFLSSSLYHFFCSEHRRGWFKVRESQLCLLYIWCVCVWILIIVMPKGIRLVKTGKVC